MELINLQATEKTPDVFFDDKKRLFEIRGNSRPENVREFYYPIVELLQDYFQNVIDDEDVDKETPWIFNFKLGYFNSSTAKFISDILLITSEYKNLGLNMKVYWHYDEGDDDMLEAGEDFSEMLEMEFQFVMVKR